MKNTTDVDVALLADHPEAIPILKHWFIETWWNHYGPDGPGDASEDLMDYYRRDGLPVGMVAYRDGNLCGFVALKAEPLPTHPHLAPWVSAGLVAPNLRGQGIGTSILIAMERQAQRMGFETLYCGTGTSASLLRRAHWELLDHADHDGQRLAIFSKTLQARTGR